MVYFRYLPLIGGLLLVLFTTACATSSTTSPATVEDRSRSLEKTEPAEAPSDTRAPRAEAADRGAETPGKTAVPPPDVNTDKETGSAGNTGSGRDYQAGPAVVALLDDADQYSGQGESQRAIASVERALRIEPKNPVLWNRLSHLHLQEGNWVQAIAMAKKSNVLASGDHVLQADNWHVIARARQKLGDKSGATQAIEKARQLDR